MTDFTVVKASDKTVGGSHYLGTIQPIHFIMANDMDFIQGNIIKYASRAKKKGAFKTDVEKIIHYASLWLEAYERGEVEAAG